MIFFKFICKIESYILYSETYVSNFISTKERMSFKSIIIMKLLTTILALVLSFSLNAQTIPDPSNASALAILKASPELNAKLKAFKLTLSEVDFKFAETNIDTVHNANI